MPGESLDPDDIGTLSSAASNVSLTKGNYTVTLNGARGGAIGQIYVAGKGNTIVDDLDGRGVGHSGMVFNELPGEAWYEGGCLANLGNSHCTTAKSTNLLTGYAYDTRGYASCYYDYENPLAPGFDLPIKHEVSFPITYDGCVQVKETVYNYNARLLTPSLYHDSFHWPIMPQAHFARTVFRNPTTNAGYWYYRTSSNTWVPFTAAKSSGWLHPTSDFYLPSGHAIGVFNSSNATTSFGVAMYCKTKDHGFYVKDMIDYGIMFVGSVYSPPAMPAMTSIDKTCQLVYGSRTVVQNTVTTLSAM